MKKSPLTPEVKKLGWVSLFTDLSGEMLYPVMPLFLQSAGLNTAVIGFMEGIAEAVAAWGKGYFGAESDRTGKRKIYIVSGYGISTLAKILLALSIFPALILLARIGDRIGKGIRSAPRDALLAGESETEFQGKIFGYHRTMDTIGAAIGPALTLLVLYNFHWNLSDIFLLAILPGLLGWLLTFFIHEKPSPTISKQRTGFFKPIKYIFEANTEYKRVVGPLFLFSLFNPTDFLLILFLKHSGFTDAGVVGCYISYNVVYALMSYPAGLLTDKKSPALSVTIGMLIFSGVYLGLVSSDSKHMILLFTCMYGLFSAFTDGTSKAWISKITPSTQKGIAIGCMQSLQSIGAILAGAIFGTLIEFKGFEYTFMTMGVGGGLTSLWMILINLKKK